MEGSSNMQQQDDFSGVVDWIHEKMQYRFENPELAKEALTHRSFYYPLKDGICYERLEFIGDSVLNFLMTDHLFKLCPSLSPGQLSLLRSANTDTEKLARVALKHGLHKFLRHKVAILEHQVEQLRKDIEKYPNHSNGLIDAPKMLANIIESMVGAVYIDSGHSLDTVWQVFERLLEPLITLETMGKHPVSELLEYCQKKGICVRFGRDQSTYDTTVKVWLGDKLIGIGSCKKKEIAQNRAAKAAIANLKKTELLQAEVIQQPPST